jgi:hypothetical protein
LKAEVIEIDARNEIRPVDVAGTAMRQLRKLLDDLNLKVGAVRFATHRGYETTD